MRDEHRPKQELIHEITGLRKQIVDLKDAMVARRRVEDALRTTESMLRALSDSVPVGLCLFRHDGTPLTANSPFARMLGYDSPAELQRIGSVLGLFASDEERTRALCASTCGGHAVAGAFFRAKDGARRPFGLMAATCTAEDSVALVVFESPPPFQPPLA